MVLISPVFMEMTKVPRYPLVVALFFCIILGSYPGNAGEFIDSAGRKVIIEGSPKRIISLAPNITEILFYLGLGDRVVGVTFHCNYPREARERPKVGAYHKASVEEILILSPDLVIATMDGNEPHVVSALEHAGIAVFVINPRSLFGVLDSILKIGEICGIPVIAQARVWELNKRIEGIKYRANAFPPQKVFLQLNTNPLITVGAHTFHQDLITLSGGVNIFGDIQTFYPRVSLEEVIKRAPDVILISSMDPKAEFEKAREGWMKWNSIPAVRDGRVYLIDSDLIDRPGPRAFDGLEKMQELVQQGIKR